VAIKVVFVLITSFINFVFAVESYNLDGEISKLKKEFSRVETERSKVRKELLQDKAEYAHYQQKYSGKTTSLQLQTDSVQSQIKLKKLINDSIELEVTTINMKIRQQQLLQKRFSETVLLAAKKLQAEIEKLPSNSSEQLRGSLHYLIGEISDGTADNAEALYRLMQIIHDTKVFSREILVAEATSPITELRGVVYTIRIGSVFEAVIGRDGKSAFVRDISGKWRSIVDQHVLSMIMLAVKIREGKAMPALVDLPLGNDAGKDVLHVQ
jgi:hypothetical protein